MPIYQPGYIKLFKTGELEQRVAQAHTHLSICDVCALGCPIDRLTGEKGRCKTGEKAIISSFIPHHGEESVLSGWRGSGTIFFSRCNLKCQYCQNHDISQTDDGQETEPEEIAQIMLSLQRHGCHNINFVSPSHVVPQILASILIAVKAGLILPLVYNTGGYDSPAMLSLLDGIIDIYMPDMKYGDSSIAQKYSKIPKYAEVNQNTVREMYRQVGDLQVDEDNLALRGLIIRHLVLPDNISGTDKVVEFISKEISKETYVNIMEQYRPVYNAYCYPEINKPITYQEYSNAIQKAKAAGLHRFS